MPNIITADTAVTPLSSYGTQKAIAELWVNDYTRKGFAVTVQSILDMLQAVAGPDVLAHIQYQHDDVIARIVASWPSQFDVGPSLALGFERDHTLENVIRAFIAES